jgi:hypothetical protein
MIRSRRLLALLVPAALVTLVWWAARGPAPAAPVEDPRLVATSSGPPAALTEEALRLYAAGQFPRACELHDLLDRAGPPALRKLMALEHQWDRLLGG